MNNITLSAPKVSASSGNTYFETKIKVLDKSGKEVERDARLIINPRWKAAQDEAIASATRNKQPSFNLLISDMERGEKDYNGTGSTWARKVTEEASEHAGNFQFQGKSYNLKIARGAQGTPFVLTLDLTPEVKLTDL
jgi:hypothetical protein